MALLVRAYLSLNISTRKSWLLFTCWEGSVGAVVYIVSFNIFPAFNQVVAESVAIGASASVMAVVVAIAVYVPDYSVNLLLIGRIK